MSDDSGGQGSSLSRATRTLHENSQPKFSNPGGTAFAIISAMSQTISRLPGSISDLFPSQFGGACSGIKRRWRRERRRRKVGRAYDMALEIARAIPSGSEVLDVGCGNGFIAHHLSAVLGTRAAGIDLTNETEAPIDYCRYDGSQFPVGDDSVDVVLLCYVLHHAQDVRVILKEAGRVLRANGLALVYEDIPQTWWDKGVCWVHNRQWKQRTGSCTFRQESEWGTLFKAFGFEIVSERSLSRWRNCTHPVRRKSYLLKREMGR
ncbi:MAG: class I SAM-dependent methyltransferase [Pyrinomonadaceae bacterium]